MRDLFDEIVKEGETAIERLMGRQEDIDFDCNVKEDHSNSNVSSSDKENFGKVLSAFANSMGGLNLWGVEARKPKPDAVDCVVRFKPISDIERFKSEMKRLATEALMPRHSGIAIEAIPSRSTPGSGYLAVYVERSDRRPHRCEFKDTKQYYRRVLDSTHAMAHFEIEDAFSRQSRARLDLELSVRANGTSSDMHGVKAVLELTLSLKNISLITARFPYLVVEEAAGGSFNSNFQIGGLNNNLFLSRKSDGFAYFEASANVVINPGISRPVETINLQIPARRDGMMTVVSQTDFGYRKVATRFGCADSPIESKSFEIKPADVQVNNPTLIFE